MSQAVTHAQLSAASALCMSSGRGRRGSCQHAALTAAVLVDIDRQVGGATATCDGALLEQQRLGVGRRSVQTGFQGVGCGDGQHVVACGSSTEGHRRQPVTVQRAVVQRGSRRRPAVPRQPSLRQAYVRVAHCRGLSHPPGEAAIELQLLIVHAFGTPAMHLTHWLEPGQRA